MSKTNKEIIIVSILAEGLEQEGRTNVVAKGELDTKYSGPRIDIDAKPTKCARKENENTYFRDGQEVVSISPIVIQLMKNRRRSKDNRETKE